MKCLICNKKTGINRLKCKMCGMSVAVNYTYAEHSFCSKKCVDAFSNILMHKENIELSEREIVL
ncbi:MAG: hypothetical protein HY513_05155 [Candidatus Aenigmarchaeota archaeon]|nr:hypothetical protein [Candidatus Aenigmarchaeota archaeon]